MITFKVKVEAEVKVERCPGMCVKEKAKPKPQP
jgi:hypothetical protein